MSAVTKLRNKEAAKLSVFYTHTLHTCSLSWLWQQARGHRTPMNGTLSGKIVFSLKWMIISKHAAVAPLKWRSRDERSFFHELGCIVDDDDADGS